VKAEMKIKLADGSGTADLKYLMPDRDRHGVLRIYFRRKGHPKICLKAPLGSEEFLAEYRAALSGAVPEKKRAATTDDRPKRAAAAPASLRWLVEEYYRRCAEFKQLDEKTTRHARALILDMLCEEPVSPENNDLRKTGTLPFASITVKAVRLMRDRKLDTPEAANNRLKALRQLFKFAIAENWMQTNPAREVAAFKTGSTGFHSWTRGEVEAFEARHPIGTKARLALALMLFTGQRRSDIIEFGRQHLGDGRYAPEEAREAWSGQWLDFTQRKNRKRKPIRLSIPFLPQLEEVIAASPCGELTFLVTAFGKPFTNAGFGNWFRDRCNEAGLTHCTAHGLRKAGATIAAENGATEKQLMSVFGWQTSKEATLYTRAASQTVLAASAGPMLVPGRKKNKRAQPSGCG
jgi:integrase